MGKTIVKNLFPIKTISPTGSQSGTIYCIGPIKIWVYHASFDHLTTYTKYLPPGFNNIIIAGMNGAQPGFGAYSTVSAEVINTTTIRLSQYNSANAGMSCIAWAIGY